MHDTCYACQFSRVEIELPIPAEARVITGTPAGTRKRHSRTHLDPIAVRQRNNNAFYLLVAGLCHKLHRQIADVVVEKSVAKQSNRRRGSTPRAVVDVEVPSLLRSQTVPSLQVPNLRGGDVTADDKVQADVENGQRGEERLKAGSGAVGVRNHVEAEQNTNTEHIHKVDEGRLGHKKRKQQRNTFVTSSKTHHATLKPATHKRTSGTGMPSCRTPPGRRPMEHMW